jgi:hypothetical protein
MVRNHDPFADDGRALLTAAVTFGAGVALISWGVGLLGGGPAGIAAGIALISLGAVCIWEATDVGEIAIPHYF